MEVTTFKVTARGVGLPDYSAPAPKGQVAKPTTYTLSDMAELAVRLGSIITFDRRGDVVWFDDFEGNINKWYVVLLGTGASIEISAESARNGSFSAKLTTGDAIGDYAQLAHYSPFPVVSKVGLEISFTLNNDLDHFSSTQTLYDGSHVHYAGLRYVPSTDKVQYIDENAAWQDLVTDLALETLDYMYHTVKFAINLKTQKYVRAILNDVEYDMSALSYRYPTSTETPIWIQGFLSRTRVASNEVIYIDDAIVTQNEP